MYILCIVFTYYTLLAGEFSSSTINLYNSFTGDLLDSSLTYPLFCIVVTSVLKLLARASQYICSLTRYLEF